MNWDRGIRVGAWRAGVRRELERLLASLAAASNTLFRGEAVDFDHAMLLVAEMCEAEKRAGVGPGEPHDEETTAALDAYAAAARRARAEYANRLAKMEQELAAEWQASKDCDVRQIGNALASGDYSDLAI